jgi:hypothetical protein
VWCFLLIGRLSVVRIILLCRCRYCCASVCVCGLYCLASLCLLTPRPHIIVVLYARCVHSRLPIAVALPPPEHYNTLALLTMAAGSVASANSSASSTSGEPVDTPAFSDGSNGYNMKYAKNRPVPRHPSVGDIPFYLLFLCYWHYLIAVIFSCTRDAIRHYKKWYVP